jgi:hypothetical protein
MASILFDGNFLKEKGFDVVYPPPRDPLPSAPSLRKSSTSNKSVSLGLVRAAVRLLAS